MASGNIPGSQPIYGYSGMGIPEYQSIMTLLKWSGILELIIAILQILIGLVTILFLVGIPILIMGILSFVIYTRINNIKAMVEAKQYTQAKSSTLIWAIVAILFSFLITGILLLLVYIKYDALITKEQQMAFSQPQSPPPNPPFQ